LTGELGDRELAELAEIGAASGLVRLGIVRLEHPGFDDARQALARYLAAGRHGEMEFLSRTAAIRADPAQMLEGARSLVVGAVPYRGSSGSIARYARSADYHTVIHNRLEPVVAAITRMFPESRSLICVDTKPVLERAAAALAGLGFIGKHGCVIVPGLGSWVLLGCVLTTAGWRGPEPTAAAVRWDACGACTRCLDACPTQAFVAPGELDPRRCISYLTIEHRGAIADELADAIGERLAGCDVCQEVCPYNAAPDREARVADAAWIEAPPGGARAADPWRLIDIGSATYRAWVKGTPVRRIARRSMRRNALVVLGNRDERWDESQRARVIALVDHEDPQIAAAARRLVARHDRRASSE
jgi:epoxyqueuosine reductase